MLLARSAEHLAGVPVESGAKVVNRLCGSSMDAVHQLIRAIEVGNIDAGDRHHPSKKPRVSKLNCGNQPINNC